MDALADRKHRLGLCSNHWKVMVSVYPDSCLLSPSGPSIQTPGLWCDCSERRAPYLKYGGVVDLVKFYAELQESLSKFKEDLLKSPTNKSANRRARSESIKIRKSLKSLRDELLSMEKKTK